MTDACLLLMLLVFATLDSALYLAGLCSSGVLSVPTIQTVLASNGTILVLDISFICLSGTTLGAASVGMDFVRNLPGSVMRGLIARNLTSASTKTVFVQVENTRGQMFP